MVVLLLPRLAQHPRLQLAAELLRVEQLVPHLAVERLRVPVLPRRPRLDVQRLQTRATHPRPDRPRDELRAVVTADVRRRAPLLHHRGQHCPDRQRCHPAPHLQRQALARVLVHQREPLQRPAVGGPVVQEVPRPDVILVLRRPPHATVDAAAQAPLLPLFPGHFEPLATPQTPDPLAVDPPAVPAQQRPDPPVAVPRVPRHQLQHPRHQLPFLLPGLGFLPLRRTRLPQHAAGAALRNPKGLLQAPDGLPALGRGHHFFWATSWSICLSRDSSATRRLRRAFSASSSRSLSASSAFMPPYWLRQR